MKAISVLGTRRPEPKADDINDEMGTFGANEHRAESLESQFLANLDSSTKQRIESMPPVSALSANITHTSKNISSVAKKYNSEKLLVSLYDIYDDMIIQFESMDYTSPITKNMADNIVKLGSCIEQVGGEIEKFSPLDHVSGLDAPPIMKCANQVIDRTKQCYKRAKIEDINVSDSGKVIGLTLFGEDENLGMIYRVKGVLSAKSSWNGAEAIDYIYTPAEGRMSVKALEGDRWIDKSSNYKVSWELQELNTAEASEEEIIDFKKGNKKEGESETPKNNIEGNAEHSNVEEVNLDFPIEEK